MDYNSETKAKSYLKSIWSFVKKGLYNIFAPLSIMDSVGYFTAILAFIAGLQWLTLEKTDQTLRAQMRPWVSVKPFIAGPLTFSADEARIEIGFLLENTGNSPAINTQVDAQIALFLSNDGVAVDYMQKICARARSTPDDNATLGHAIFPKDKFTYSISLAKRKSDIENAMTNWSQEKNGWFAPVIVGCVTYRIPHERGRHGTEFVADLRKIDKANPKSPGMFKMSDGNVAVSDMVLTREFVGGNAD